MVVVAIYHHIQDSIGEIATWYQELDVQLLELIGPNAVCNTIIAGGEAFEAANRNGKTTI